MYTTWPGPSPTNLIWTLGREVGMTSAFGPPHQPLVQSLGSGPQASVLGHGLQASVLDLLLGLLLGVLEGPRLRRAS